MQTEGFSDAQPDRQQFVEEFSRCSRRLYGYILSLTLNRNDAEEVFQTTSIVLYQKYAQFEPISASFYTWACRVAYLEVLHFRRTRKRDGLLTERALELLHDELIRRSDEFEHREEALEKCLKKLSEPDRTLIAERYYNDLAPKQIADRLGRSINSIYRSLARVHVMLRSCVSRTLAYGD
jgi:RNA polymerase sigma-70 factor (ECF subfamily)